MSPDVPKKCLEQSKHPKLVETRVLCVENPLLENLPCLFRAKSGTPNEPPDETSEDKSKISEISGPNLFYFIFVSLSGKYCNFFYFYFESKMFNSDYITL